MVTKITDRSKHFFTGINYLDLQTAEFTTIKPFTSFLSVPCKIAIKIAQNVASNLENLQNLKLKKFKHFVQSYRLLKQPLHYLLKNPDFNFLPLNESS